MVTETVVAASAEETVSEEQVPTRQQLRRERREARRKAREERRAARREAAAADERPAETTDGETAAETGTEELDAETADEDVATVEDGEETDDTLDGEAVPEGDTGGEATAEEEKERVIVGYHHVKIFRSDLQAVCDSLVSFSRDTTIHLHKDPVMWNGDNQIKSDRTVVYIKDEVIDHAVFTGGEEHGNPVMSAELDADHYNQITGKTIEALPYQCGRECPDLLLHAGRGDGGLSGLSGDGVCRHYVHHLRSGDRGDNISRRPGLCHLSHEPDTGSAAAATS